jgi:hypothetical protein
MAAGWLTMPAVPDARLRARCHLAGLALALAAVLPVETSNDGARFVWELAPDLGARSLLVLLAPALGGALVLVATRACRRAGTLAALVLAASAGLAVILARGADALAADLLASPEPWIASPFPALVAVALVVAARSAPDARASRALLLAAAAAAAAHLVLPADGESPARLALRVLGHVGSAGGARSLLGAALLVALVVWPALAVAIGSLRASRSAPAAAWTAALAAYGLPALLGPPARRSLADPWGQGPSAAGLLGGLALLAAVLLLLASAVAHLAEQGRAALLAERWTALAAAAVLLALAASPAPAPLAPDWPVGPPTPEADRVFGALLPRWNEGSAEATAALVPAARRLDEGLGAALAALVSESGPGGILERRWYRLVDRVNEASRRAALPYYVDPTGLIVDGERRSPRVDAYRIERAQHVTAAGRGFTTLHVRALSPERPRPAALGLSRDVQPYAVVALDELAAYQGELERLAASPVPRCGETAAESEAATALRDCGAALAAAVGRGELGAALLDATARHELQHRIDGAHPSPSAWLRSRVAWLDPASRARTERELSAYLAQMTAPGAAPRITLLRLLRLALVIRRGVEHDVARLAFAALGGGVPVEQAYGALAARSDEGLRVAAAAAWRLVYGGELATVAPR